ncbi:MAG TPA: hypothetical protein VFG74_01100 [Miltoncostaeaceae bacterium]|nr:hypothetical protein [Miltoncostaeaceae bacterium]
MTRLLISSLAALALALCGTAVAQGATFPDPAGDNCAGGPCGPDLTGLTTSVAADGTTRLTLTRTSSVCNTISYPATEVQPSVQFLAAAATSRDDTSSYRGFVWAVSTTSDFVFSPPGTGGEVPLAGTVTPGTGDVVLPPAVVASMGGLPLKLFVTNSCRDWPFEPITASRDLIPDSGLITLAAEPAAGAGGGGAGPGAGAGPGPAAPGAGGAGPRPRTMFTGSPGRDRLVGNARANTLRGLAGNDTLLGKGGADTLMGGPGRDRLVGGPGRDRLIGGPGIDTCVFDAKDVLRGCEKKVRA